MCKDVGGTGHQRNLHRVGRNLQKQVRKNVWGIIYEAGAGERLQFGRLLENCFLDEREFAAGKDVWGTGKGEHLQLGPSGEKGESFV